MARMAKARTSFRIKAVSLIHRLFIKTLLSMVYSRDVTSAAHITVYFFKKHPAGDADFKLQMPMPMPVRCSSRIGALLHSLIGAMFCHWRGGRPPVPLACGGEGQPQRRSEGAAKYWSTDQTLKSYVRMNGTWCVHH